MIKKIDKIFRLIKLWLLSDNKWIDPHKIIRENSLSDRETILYLKKNPKVGIVRNGNSELGLMVGNSPRTQEYDKNLAEKLIDNCRNYNFATRKKYLLALPLETLVVGYTKRTAIPKWYPGRAARLAMRFLVKKNQTYASQFCFRIIDVEDEDMDSYLRLVESLFSSREVIYVGPMQGKNPEIPKFITPVEILKIPEKNAYSKFHYIVEQIKKLSMNYKDPLVVIVGGATASVISYELNISNITCYDFGQYNRLYKKYLHNKTSD